MPPPGSLAPDDAAAGAQCGEASNNTWAQIDARAKTLIVAGAMKAGTTWLFSALSAHPGFIHAAAACVLPMATAQLCSGGGVRARRDCLDAGVLLTSAACAYIQATELGALCARRRCIRA
jgi:hypothetical protein